MTRRSPGEASPSAPLERRCPLCERATDQRLCPEDGMATLLVEAPTSDPAQLTVGTTVGGRYVIKRLIGSGGSAWVFEAAHTGTGQPVALKVLAGGAGFDDVPVRRFFREARVTAGLQHPSTVRVFDFGQDDTGLVYLALELLAGHTLRHELQARLKVGQAFTEAEATAIAVTITRSLSEAHASGLVHRDLKPDNVFLHEVAGNEPMVKVLDFGIVKSQDSSLTDTDSAVGTPRYMSPEQVIGSPVDARSDLYSLGIVLYQLVSGVVPFRGATPVATAIMHVGSVPEPIGKVALTPLSEAFAAIVHRALAKDPSDRFPDARAMREALLACAETRTAGDHHAPAAGMRLEAPPSAAPGPEPLAAITPPTHDEGALPTLGVSWRAALRRDLARQPRWRLGAAALALAAAVAALVLPWRRAQEPGSVATEGHSTAGHTAAPEGRQGAPRMTAPSAQNPHVVPQPPAPGAVVAIAPPAVHPPEPPGAPPPATAPPIAVERRPGDDATERALRREPSAPSRSMRVRPPWRPGPALLEPKQKPTPDPDQKPAPTKPSPLDTRI